MFDDGDEVRPSLRDLTAWIDRCVGRGPEDGANPSLATTVDSVAVVGADDGCGADEHADGLMTDGAGMHDELEGGGTVAVGRALADPKGHSIPLLCSHSSQGPNPGGVDADDGHELSMDQVIH